LLAPVRILIADDYKDWRRVVRLLFQARPEWQIIAEASDGSEAVQKAEELKPDLILLDIGLPKLNGIEAALQIKQLSPSSKIIFVSLYNSQDVVQTALATGARGYVHKTDANGELSSAVEAVLQGRQYVSSGAKDSSFAEAPGEKAPHCHEVMFYSDETVLLDRLSRFIAAALNVGKAAIVLATKGHRDDLLQRLKTCGVDTESALRQGTYIALDAADVLSTVMVNDLPDPDRFLGVLGGFIEAGAKATKAAQPRVAAFGEAVNLLKAQGKPEAAIRVEQLWNDAGKIFGLDILCGYDLSNFHGDEDERVFQSVCAEHSAVYSQ
jgi:DNA-binding NarL/FixJ family response regulator